MRAGRKKRAYVLHSVAGAILWQVVLVVTMLWILPNFGVNIPTWLMLVFMTALSAYSYVTFRFGEKVITKTPAVGIETIIGVKGETTTKLSPYGYVRVEGELWRACSIDRNINQGIEVVIIDIKGVTLFVMPSQSISSRKYQTEESEGEVNHERQTQANLDRQGQNSDQEGIRDERISVR